MTFEEWKLDKLVKTAVSDQPRFTDIMKRYSILTDEQKREAVNRVYEVLTDISNAD